MVTIEHGDLIEQRRGGVDVLRILVRNLALYEQSGAPYAQPPTRMNAADGFFFVSGNP